MVKHSRQRNSACIFIVISVLLVSNLSLVFSINAVSEAPHSKVGCNNICGNTSVPYPFYLKPCSKPNTSTEFGLECYEDSTLMITLNKASYTVTSIYPYSIIINPNQSSCSIDPHNFTIDGLRSYAISTNNIVQLNCTKAVNHNCPLSCNIPSQGNNEQCKFGNTCCYYLDNVTNWQPGDTNFTQFSQDCTGFTSWALQTIVPTYHAENGLKLDWALQGDCTTIGCDSNANCSEAKNVKGGVNCACKDGYIGDGYVEGTGCRRGKSSNEVGIAGKSSNKVGIARKSSNKVGIVLGILGGFLLCLFAFRRRFKSAALRKENPDTEVYSAIGKEHGIVFNLEIIKAATRNFHDGNKLGEGGFGSVYKGTMVDGKEIAVKKLSLKSFQGKKEFLNEVKLVAKIQHRNLVKLLGYCTEKSERLLVYELLANRSLDKILFDDERRRELDWAKRMNIICGIARGLLYLHEDSHLRIIHRDIKSSNILLDEKMEPKISDFGLARLIRQDESHVETRVAGTYGYMAPEYAMLGQLSAKADVYSFGVVILEIICGRKNTDNRLFPQFQSLVELVWKYYNGGNIVDVIDREIIESFSSEQVSRCIYVGLLCTQADVSLRPPMTTIYAMLSNLSIESIIDPTIPAYLNVEQSSIPSQTSTSISPTKTTSSSTSFMSNLVPPSINHTSITKLDPR